jgi:hypothetical protein
MPGAAHRLALGFAVSLTKVCAGRGRADSRKDAPFVHWQFDRSGSISKTGDCQRSPLPLKGLLGRLSVPDPRRQAVRVTETASRRRSAGFAGASSVPKNYASGITIPKASDAVHAFRMRFMFTRARYCTDRIYIFLVRTVLYGAVFGIRSWGTPSDAILGSRGWQGFPPSSDSKDGFSGHRLP